MEGQKQGRVTVLVDTITVKDMEVQRIVFNALAVNGYDVEIVPEYPQGSEDTTATVVIHKVVQ